MNILFVYSLDDMRSMARPLRWQMQIQFGISYISALLRTHKHNTSLVVLCKFFGKANEAILSTHIKRMRPELICFSSVSSEYNFIAAMARYVRKNFPSIFLLIGGSHVSLNPEGVLADAFDALCIGEGEYPVLELVTQLESGISANKIPNLWLKKGNAVERNPTRPFLKELDRLPLPDRQMWQSWINKYQNGAIPVLLGRGCPFECTYCCNHALKTLAAGGYVRLRSVNNILSELEHISVLFPKKKSIYFEVETFGIDTAWALDLCKYLEDFNKKLDAPLSFGVNLRVVQGLELERLFAAMGNANFKWVNIGLESGSAAVRSRILKREYKNQEIIEVVKCAKKNKLKVALYNLIGLPGETLSDFQETLKLNRLCLPDRNDASIFFPYPGTALHALCKEEGLLRGGINVGLERKNVFIDSSQFTKKQIWRNYLLFDYHVYKGYRPAYKMIVRALVIFFESRPYLNFIFWKLFSLPLLRRMQTY